MLNLEIIYKCTRIQDCYPKDEQFSDKIIHLFTENLDLIKDSIVYYDGKIKNDPFYPNHLSNEEILEEVKKLSTQRETVNMKYNNYTVKYIKYKKERLLENLKYETNYYTSFYNRTGKLLPNIAFYCKTPVITLNKKLNILSSVIYDFNFINNSPDYTSFIDSVKNNKDLDKLKTILITRFEKIYEKAIYCALDNNIEKIVFDFACYKLWLFGVLYMDSKQYKELIRKLSATAFVNVYERNSDFLGKELFFYSTDVKEYNNDITGNEYIEKELINRSIIDVSITNINLSKETLITINKKYDIEKFLFVLNLSPYMFPGYASDNKIVTRCTDLKLTGDIDIDRRLIIKNGNPRKKLNYRDKSLKKITPIVLYSQYCEKFKSV
jgi:hypothetical protein